MSVDDDLGFAPDESMEELWFILASAAVATVLAGSLSALILSSGLWMVCKKVKFRNTGPS